MDRASAPLVVTGAPGVGKSTVARLLAQQHGDRAVHLHCDDFFAAIRSGHVSPYRPEAQSQNSTVNEAIARAASSYVDGGYFVVIDGVIGPWSLPIFLKHLPDLHYVVLRPPLQVALARATARGAAGFDKPAVIREVYELFEDMGPYERFIVDTGSMTPHLTAETLRRRIEAGLHRIPFV